MPPFQDIIKSQTPQRKLLKERTSRDRQGLKPRPLVNRLYKPRGPIIRPNKSYAYKRKVEVLMFCHYHRVLYIDPLTRYIDFRPPTLQEALAYSPPNYLGDKENKILLEHGKSKKDLPIFRNREALI